MALNLHLSLRKSSLHLNNFSAEPDLLVPIAYCISFWRKSLIITKYIYVAFFLLGEFPVSEFYVPTFRDIRSVTSS